MLAVRIEVEPICAEDDLGLECRLEAFDGLKSTLAEFLNRR